MASMWDLLFASCACGERVDLFVRCVRDNCVVPVLLSCVCDDCVEPVLCVLCLWRVYGTCSM